MMANLQPMMEHLHTQEPNLDLSQDSQAQDSPVLDMGLHHRIHHIDPHNSNQVREVNFPLFLIFTSN